MKFHDLKRHTPQKKKKLVGRGGKRGKTSGKGTKGQKARAGRKMRPELRDLIKKIPKLRGYKFSPVSERFVPVNLSALENKFSNAETVNPHTLMAHGVVSLVKGVLPKVKILGDGELTKKLTIEGCAVSKSAKEKIEKVGGAVAQAVAPAKK